jgi:hypothetical protein
MSTVGRHTLQRCMMETGQGMYDLYSKCKRILGNLYQKSRPFYASMSIHGRRCGVMYLHSQARIKQSMRSVNMVLIYDTVFGSESFRPDSSDSLPKSKSIVNQGSLTSCLLLLSSRPRLFPFPLFRRQTSRRPSMNRFNLFLQHAIHQPTPLQQAFILEIGRHNYCIEGLTTAARHIFY